MPSRKNKGMGLDFGLQSKDLCWKTTHRWLFTIENIIGGEAGSINTLPPSKSARPSLSFKEQEVEHINETISFPMKPEWKPINLSLYDIKLRNNPIFNWIKLSIYNPQSATWHPSLEYPSQSQQFKKRGTLELFSGCGDVLETWIYENCYPESADWGDLDMGESNIVMVDITLRYDRAYFIKIQ